MLSNRREITGGGVHSSKEGADAGSVGTPIADFKKSRLFFSRTIEFVIEGDGRVVRAFD